MPSLEPETDDKAKKLNIGSDRDKDTLGTLVPNKEIVRYCK